MYGTHDWDVAYLLPHRVLAHLHEKEHAEPEWHQSQDSSRGPGFIAGKHMAIWRHEDVQPGDQISQQEQHARLRAMRDHLKGLGIGVQETDERGYEHIAPHFTLDTGHRVSVGHSMRDQTWRASVYHPGDDSIHARHVVINLGVNAGHVPHLLARELGSQPVAGEMRAQQARAQQAGLPPPPPRWRNPDGSRWYPDSVSFTARGAQLPEDGGEEDY